MSKVPPGPVADLFRFAAKKVRSSGLAKRQARGPNGEVCAIVAIEWASDKLEGKDGTALWREAWEVLRLAQRPQGIIEWSDADATTAEIVAARFEQLAERLEKKT